MRLYQFFYIILFLAGGCRVTNNQREMTGSSNDYARGFHIEERNEWTRLTVFNPWAQAQNVSANYYLVDKEGVIADTLIGQNVIRTPVTRVVCLSTTHLAFLDALGVDEAVVGISGSRYVSGASYRKRLDAGMLPDVGYGQNLNYELMVSLHPDLVMIYGVGSEVTGNIQKLKELNIPVILVAEYLEETPLGKAEWIRFVGALFQKEPEAVDYFNRVKDEYGRLKQKLEGIQEKPKILVGSPYKDTWWVPGGNSYLANLIADAGGQYLGKENLSHESYAISFENALIWGNEADIWIHMGNMTSRAEIIAADSRFGELNVFVHGNIYNNIKRLGVHGGNDFWESGTVNPHRILNDLIAIFHPQYAEGGIYYYQEIK